MHNVVLAEEWKENFRMSQESFLQLCSLLRPFIERKVTSVRAPVDVETQVAVTLYYLSDEGRMRKTANVVGQKVWDCCHQRLEDTSVGGHCTSLVGNIG